jgi:hypothetical protein
MSCTSGGAVVDNEAFDLLFQQSPKAARNILTTATNTLLATYMMKWNPDSRSLLRIIRTLPTIDNCLLPPHESDMTRPSEADNGRYLIFCTRSSLGVLNETE